MGAKVFRAGEGIRRMAYGLAEVSDDRIGRSSLGLDPDPCLSLQVPQIGQHSRIASA